MKPFLKSPLPIVASTLILFTVLTISVVFLSAVSLASAVMSSLGEVVKWELAGAKYNTLASVASYRQETPATLISIEEGVSVSSRITDELSSDSRVSRLVVAQVIASSLEAYEGGSTTTDQLSILKEFIPYVVVLHNVRLSELGVQSGVALDRGVLSLNRTVKLPINNVTVSLNLLDLLYSGLEHEFVEDSEELKELLDELYGIYCLQFSVSQFFVQCTGYNLLAFIPPVQKLIFDERSFNDVGLIYMKSLRSKLGSLNIDLTFYTYDVFVFIDLKSESYFNPASVQGSLENAGAIANELRSSLGFEVLSNAPLQNIASRYSTVETAFRISSVAGVIPAFIVLLMVLQPISEMLVLGMRRVYGLMRIRGVSRSLTRRWFYSVLAVSLVVGLVLGMGLSYVLGLTYFRIPSPQAIIADPVILGVTAILITVEVVILARKIAGISSKISPSEAMKTTLIPEGLLQPMRMGGSGWFSVAAGAYFIVTGLSGYSATTVLASSMVGGAGNINIALIIILAILSTFESLIKPFAPALAAYGFVKLYVINHERFWDVLHRSLLSRSGLALPSKSMALSVRRRVAPVLVLLAFSVCVMTQSLISSDSTQFLFDSALNASVGSEFLLKKELQVNLSSGGSLRHVLDSLQGDAVRFDGLDREASAIISINVWSVIEDEDSIYKSVNNLVVIRNATSFLSSTYWYDEWSQAGDFSKAIRDAGLNGNAVIVMQPQQVVIGGLRARVSLARVPQYRNVSAVLATPETYTPESVLNVIDVVAGFPGAPNIGFRQTYSIVVGDWILDRAELLSSMYVVGVGGVNKSTVTIFVYTLSNSTASELIDEGFSLVKSADSVRRDATVNLARSLMVSSGGLSQASVVFMLLSAGIAVTVAYTIAVETSRAALLMRVRGLSPSGTFKLNLLYWFTVVTSAVLLGSLVGLALSLSDLTTYSTSIGGTSIIYLFSQLLGGEGLYINLGVLRFVTSPMLVTVTVLVLTVASLVPALTTQLVYRGRVRERFIEVR